MLTTKCERVNLDTQHPWGAGGGLVAREADLGRLLELEGWLA